MVNIGKPLIILSSIDSTNIYAMQEINDGLATHGKAYFTFEQTAGKGQRGNKWHSEPGQNMMLSVVLIPKNLSSSDIFFGSAAIATGCFDFFSAIAGEETRIKWPNDIYWRDRKAGGILIENIFAGQKWKYSVVGIGININQVLFDPALSNPVSLRQITGKTFNIQALLDELFACLSIRWNQLYEDKQSILTLYNEKLYKKNCIIRIKKDTRSFYATLKGVTANGQLEVFSTSTEYFTHGEGEIKMNLELGIRNYEL
jgi:BirA family biotin operon repressor/biotin-[acetyl-CoA-carboxylase] ligase